MPRPRPGSDHRPTRRARLIALLLFAAAVLSACGLASAVPWPIGAIAAAGSPAPRAGFTFSPRDALRLGLDVDTTLASLLDELQPDVLRLPVYWSFVEPRQGVFDFAATDSEISTVSAWAARHPARPLSLVLVVGVRNIGFPEVFSPPWAVTGPVTRAARLAASADYARYVGSVVPRYRGLRLLSAWQVENEPLDSVPDTLPAVEPAVDEQAVLAGRDLVHAGDPTHPVLLTTYDSSTLDLDQKLLDEPPGLAPPRNAYQPAGHPEEMLEDGDILGLDAYAVTSDADAASAPAPIRIDWKAAELSFWAQRAQQAGKQLWISEMQAEPFTGTAPGGFTPADMLAEAREYRASGASVILLWGAGDWLRYPLWLAAANQALAVLRGAAA